MTIVNEPPAARAAEETPTTSTEERGPSRAHATLRKDGTSVVTDPGEASLLHSKGYYGSFVGHGTLELDARETLYLVDVGRLEIGQTARGPTVALPDLVHRVQCAEPGFEIPYLVYRDLRQRGYVVRTGPGDVEFSVLPRGGTYPTTPSQYWVWAISERKPFDLQKLVAQLGRAQSARKKILLGIVDEESDLTYYQLRPITPKGRVPALAGGPVAEGVLLDDRVTVFDPEAVERLGQGGAYGSLVGHRLDLSLVEAAYLIEEERLALTDGATRRRVGRSAFLEHAHAIEPELDVLLRTYRDLRRSGLIPKTGFKYGAHFRAYEGDPAQNHARFLVHSVLSTFSTSWPEISRAIRLAHGVKKTFLLSWTEGKEPPGYLSLQRIRP